MSSNVEDSTPAKGHFITLEGGEGAGKSTQVRRLVGRLQERGIDALATREPGGTPKAEAMRTALLGGVVAPFGPAAEALVFAAARIDHLDRKILPALRDGRTVVCDRFIDSTRAYQGALGHVDQRLIAAIERVTLCSAMPHLTLVLDLPSDLGLARVSARRQNGAGADRFEREDAAFHTALRRAFLEIANQERDRCYVIDASRPPDEVADAIWRAVVERLLGRERPQVAPGGGTTG